MTMTLDALALECRRLLQAHDAPTGRAQVAALLGRALRDPEFVRAQFSGGLPERKVLYEDPELGFCILGHQYHGPKEGGPHDHGPSWAIYGQAEGETMMTDFVVVQPPIAGQPGKVRRGRSYALRPGDAHLYNEGAVHAPSRGGPTKLIRIEGVNLENVERGKYEVVAL
jgi:hypothetical protein